MIIIALGCPRMYVIHIINSNCTDLPFNQTTQVMGTFLDEYETFIEDTKYDLPLRLQDFVT